MTLTDKQTQKKNLTYPLSSQENKNQELNEDLTQSSCLIYYTRTNTLTFCEASKTMLSEKPC